ncbi:MAG TPA: Co2+/Mg2+ efflux protein ApaG [Caulobacteraceae bacterium]
MTSHVYEAETRGVRVRVVASYLPQQSDPDDGRWVWAYVIEIENEGDETVQLVDRHWTITDGHGQVEEVQGPGVVGEQPVIPPGGRYQYTSGCPLGTDSGVMVGSYGMITEAGERFEAAIPAFSLHLPGADRAVN